MPRWRPLSPTRNYVCECAHLVLPAADLVSRCAPPPTARPDIDFLVKASVAQLMATAERPSRSDRGEDRRRSFLQAFGNAPIIEVSGRVFPVETIYLPLDHDREEAGETSYVDAAVNAVDLALDDPVRGDVLIFMPGERDIREARDLLEGRHGGHIEVIPLFGRLSSAEQERVFAQSGLRKVIVATNIAETCLTIPGHPLCYRYWPCSRQPIQPAHAHSPAPHRTDFRKAAPTNAKAAPAASPTAFASAFTAKRNSTPARNSASRKSSAPTSPKSSCA